MRKKVVLLVAGLATMLGGAPVVAAQQVVLTIDHVRAAPARPGGGGANCTNAGATNASEYGIIGWHVAGATTTHFNTSSIPSGLGSASTLHSTFQAAYNAWSGPGPSITVADDGTATKATRNGLNEIAFGRTGGTTIAVTYTWSSGNTVLESDTIFNDRLAWSLFPNAPADGCDESTAKYDVQSIATHEFGHTYGLDHPNPGRFETMYAYGYTGETLKRSLGAGDSAGINAVY
jgi:hypothetical protein